MNSFNLIDKKHFKEYKKEAILLKPCINIGKNGMTNSIIDEIKKQLKIKKLIKVKILINKQNILNLKDIASELELNCKANLINIIGHTIVLYKK